MMKFPFYNMFLILVLYGFEFCKYVISQDAMQVLVYIPTKSTWTEAHDICTAGGGFLVSVDSPERIKELSYLDTKPVWNLKIKTTQFWTGMYIEQEGIPCDSAQFKLHAGGYVSGTWTNWYPNEPDLCQTDLCIRLSNKMWRTRNCTIKYNVLCQYNVGECDMETFANMSLSDSTINMTVNKTLVVRGDAEYCSRLCLQSRLYDMRCWVVAIHKANPRKCILYYSEETISRLDVNETSADTDLYIRRCVDARAYSGDPSHPFENETTTTMMMTTSSPECPTTEPTFTTTDVTPEMSTSADNILCFKQMFSNLSSAELQQAVDKLQKQLQVLKSDTVLYKLRRISVYEERSSAVGLGLISALCLGFLFAIMVIADIPKISLQIKRNWCRKRKRSKNPVTS